MTFLTHSLRDPPLSEGFHFLGVGTLKIPSCTEDSSGHLPTISFYGGGMEGLGHLAWIGVRVPKVISHLSLTQNEQAILMK